MTTIIDAFLGLFVFIAPYAFLLSLAISAVMTFMAVRTYRREEAEKQRIVNLCANDMKYMETHQD